MGWLVAVVWIGAVVVAALVLGFCAYELHWKSRRLRADLSRLTALGEPLAGLVSTGETMRRRLGDVER